MATPKLLPALAAALALLPLSGADAATTLKNGIYDCYAIQHSTGFLAYINTVNLRPGNRYEHAFGRKKRVLLKKTSGRYRVTGDRIEFPSGTMRKTPGRVKPADTGHLDPYFDLYVNGKPSGVSCYFVRKF